MAVREWLWVGAAAAGAAVVGCATGPRYDPPAASGPVMEEAARLGYTGEAVAHGRDVYVLRCGRCHSLKRPADYSEEKWDTILPRMSRKAGLDRGEEADVRAYVISARLRDAGGSGEAAPSGGGGR